MNEMNQSYAEQAGFKKVAGVWVGKLSGFLFKLTESDKQSANFAVEFTLSGDDAKDTIVGKLDELAKSLVIDTYSVEDNSFKVQFIESNGQYGLKELLGAIVGALSEGGAHSACASCGSHSFVDFYTNGVATTPLCGECYRSIADAKKIEANLPNNYALGMVGSLLGAVIGSVLWIVIGAIGFYASIAGYAIAFAAFKGYEVVNAKKTRVGIVINVSAIVIALLLAQYVGVFIDVVKEYPTLTVSQFVTVTPELVKDMEFVKGMLPNMALGLLFAILGSYRVIKNNYQQANHADKNTVERVSL